MKSYIEKTYAEEISRLPIIEEIKFTVKYNTDELLIRSVKYKVLPKIKFVRGKDKRIHISDTCVATFKIPVPFSIIKETISRDCTKFHQDTIEYVVERKEYKQPELNDFINIHLEKFTRSHKEQNNQKE